MNGFFFFAKVQVPCVTHIPGLWFNNEQKSQFLNMIKQQILFNDFTLPSSGSQHLLRWKLGIFPTLMKGISSTVKLWKISERCYAPSNFNLRDDQGVPRNPEDVTTLRVPVFKPSELVVEASPRRVYANAHTYHINSISLNSDDETYLSADDLRINLWHLGINDQSYSILSALE